MKKFKRKMFVGNVIVTKSLLRSSYMQFCQMLRNRLHIALNNYMYINVRIIYWSILNGLCFLSSLNKIDAG